MSKSMRQICSHVLGAMAFLGLAWLSSFLSEWPLCVAVLWTLVGGGLSIILIFPAIIGTSKDGRMAAITWDRPTKIALMVIAAAAVAYLGHVLYLGWHLMPLPDSPRVYRAGPVLVPSICIGMILPSMVRLYWLKNGTPQ